MLKHHLLLIWRNIGRFKSTFFINLIGLSTGLACVLLIYLWLLDERQVDQFFDNKDRIFQIVQNLNKEDGIETIDATSGLLAKALADEMPEVEYAASAIPVFFNSSAGVVSVHDNRMKVRGQYVTEDYLRIFSYPLLKGTPADALHNKEGIVISEKLALKLFSSIDVAMGQSIQWKGQSANGSYFISGVFQSPPSNASLQFDVLMNYEVFLKDHDYIAQWGNSDPFTYVLLREGASAERFNEKIKGFVKSKMKNAGADLYAQPYTDRYLYGRYENGVPSGGRIEYVKLFIIIAFFILVIACINFMNLSTAKASRKVKGVGIKKAMGAGRWSLVLQYMGESVFISLLSLAVAVLLVDLLLPQFNLITGKHLHLSLNPVLICTLIAIALFTGILSGSYPALYLSGFSPSSVLKGKVQTTVGELITRKGLVVFQFSVSVILIICVGVIYAQMQFIQSRNLGYQRDHVVYFDTEKISDAFMAELKAIPGVINAGRFYHDLVGGHGGTGDIQWPGKSPDNNTDFSNLEVGHDLIETMGMQMSAGNSFSDKISWEDQIIFNEAAIERMGLKDPVGQTVIIWGMKRKIVGVVKNFHFESMYEKVTPCFLFLVPMVKDTPGRIMVKIARGSEQSTLESLAAFYLRHNEGLPFSYTFLEDDYQRLYASEQRVSKLSGYFAALAVIISSLGLFALAAFTAERRSKEIGIRKVLGSSEWRIIYLLSADFTKTVLIAAAIALPLAYYITTQWLAGFAYRIALQWWYFAGAVSMALLIAWITVGTQAYKASRINPVKCLKEE